MYRLPERPSSEPSTRLSQNVASNPIFKSRNSQKTFCSWPSVFCLRKLKINPIEKIIKNWGEKLNVAIGEDQPDNKNQKSGKNKTLAKTGCVILDGVRIKMYGYTTWTGT